MDKFTIFGQFVRFLAARKKFWLIPIVIVFFVASILLVATQGSVLSPFIYTLI